MTLVRLLDGAALATGAALLSALVVWWARPEIIFLVLLGLVTARVVIAPVRLPALSPRRAVAIGVAAYAAGFSFVTVTRHFAFRTHALDLGYYVQLVWSIATGRGPQVSLPEMSAWGDHLSPIMYLFVPVFWVAPGAVALLVAQSVALALGAIAVFALARAWVGGERAAAAFAALYLVNPSLHGVNVRDVHAAALAIPLLLVAIWAGTAERWGIFAAAAVLCLACREDAALALIGLGAWLGAGRRRWLGGAVVIAGAAAILAADVRWVIPWFRGEPYPHLGRYAHLGTSLASIATDLALHPVAALATILTMDRLVYALALLAPLGFLPLLAPAELMGAVPALAQNLLASDPILFNHRTQYQSFVLPFLMAAAIRAYGRLSARHARATRRVLGFALVASVALSARTVNDLAVERWWPTEARRGAYSVLGRVPEAASVSAQDPYVPHLSLRPLVFVFPVAIDRSDYVLLNSASYPWRNLPGTTMSRDGDAVRVGMPDGKSYDYAVAAESGPHLLLRRQK